MFSRGYGPKKTTEESTTESKCVNPKGQKVGHALVVYGIGFSSQISGPEIEFSGPEISSKIPCFAGSKKNFLKFQTLKFQNLGPEIWQIHPPPIHTTFFACLVMQKIHSIIK